MKDFIYNKKKVNLISRIRIPENRDLKKGVRLNRNERVENFDTKIISKIFQKTQDLLRDLHIEALFLFFG